MKTETKVQHTPTPWNSVLSTVYAMDLRGFIDEENIICSVINKPDAAFIVRAVNCHEELLNCLKGAMMIVKAFSSDNDTVFVKEVDKAIAKAEGL